MTQPNTDLSFDPRDPYFPSPDGHPVRWAVQVFTTSNGYGLDPAVCEVDLPDADTVVMRADGYAFLGQQRRSGDGTVLVRLRHED
jgi:hypothetical protein